MHPHCPGLFQDVVPPDSPQTSSSLFGSQVLAELKEYATEVDVDFVRKAVRAIGRCAIKVEVRLWDSVLSWGEGERKKAETRKPV